MCVNVCECCVCVCECVCVNICTMKSLSVDVTDVLV